MTKERNIFPSVRESMPRKFRLKTLDLLLHELMSLDTHFRVIVKHGEAASLAIAAFSIAAQGDALGLLLRFIPCGGCGPNLGAIILNVS